MLKYTLILILSWFTTSVLAQNGVIISETQNDNVDASAILELKSTNKGFLVPRITSTNNIGSPTDGLIVYQTGNPAGFYVRQSGAWKLLGEAGNVNEVDPKVGTLTDNKVPVWNDTDKVLENSFITNNNTSVTISDGSNGGQTDHEFEDGSYEIMSADGSFTVFQVRRSGSDWGLLDTFGSNGSRNIRLGSFNNDFGSMVLYNNDLDNTNPNNQRIKISVLGDGTGIIEADKITARVELNGPSDRRLKKEIEPFHDGLEKLQKINPVWFQYNGLGGQPITNNKFVGIIAQDIEPYFPYMLEKTPVKLRKDDKELTDVWYYSPTALTYVLVNAVKEQQVLIQEQKNEIEKLNNILLEQNRQTESLQNEKELLKASLEKINKRITDIERLLGQ